MNHFGVYPFKSILLAPSVFLSTCFQNFYGLHTKKKKPKRAKYIMPNVLKAIH